MSDITTRIAEITREHAHARAIAGVTGRTTTTQLNTASPARMRADHIADAERARDARMLSERARHAEASRLARRMRAIEDARRAAESAGDMERAARLELLYGDVESARDRYTHATFQRPALVEDWAPGGRFRRYARRWDLGFIGYDADDIAQDAAEILTAAGLFYATSRIKGDDPAGHTIGDAYRALRHAYRRGLGFYGYERRGKVVERDLSERGYTVHESDGAVYIRERAARDASIVATHVRDAFADIAFNVDFDVDDDDARALIRLAEQRRRGMQTLSARFPLNADGRMLALATLLTEGYTIDELTEGLGVQERTLFAWAEQLGGIAGVHSTERDDIDRRDAFQVVDDLVDATR